MYPKHTNPLEECHDDQGTFPVITRVAVVNPDNFVLSEEDAQRVSSKVVSVKEISLDTASETDQRRRAY